MSRGISKFQIEIMKEIGKCGSEGVEMHTVLMALSHKPGRYWGVSYFTAHMAAIVSSHPLRPHSTGLYLTL